MTDSSPHLERSRTPVTVRLRPGAIEMLDTLAHRHSLPGLRVTRTDIVKAALAIAFANPGELAKTVIKTRDGV